MKYIDLDLKSDKKLIAEILFSEYKNSFYHDVLPSERVEVDGGLSAIPTEWLLGIDDNIDKDNNSQKLTLTKNNNKKLKS